MSDQPSAPENKSPNLADNSPASDNATPKNPAQSNDASQQKAGANLRHFGRHETPEDIPLKPSPMSKIGDSLEKAKQVLTKTPNTKAASPQANKAFNWIKKHVLVTLILAIVIPVGTIIAVNIPSLLARSKAFSLYESGNYEAALREFRTYLSNNPTDANAALQAASIAVSTEDYTYAAQVLKDIANVGDASSTDEYRFIYALSNIPHEKSLATLDKLMSSNPKHGAGRLLRGISLLQDEDKTALARDDFLEAHNIIRNSENFDNTNIIAVHTRIVNAFPPILPTFDLPLQTDNVAMQNIAQYLNIPPVYSNLYINNYFPILPTSPVDSEIDDDAIVSMYYTLLLLQVEELEEAEVELSKLPEHLLTDSLAGSLWGIYYSMRGDYNRGKEVFGNVASLYPNDPKVLFNLANASYLADQTPTGVATALELLNKVISLDSTMLAAYHNRAFLSLLNGDQESAKKDIQFIINDFRTAQTKTLRALIALSENPTDPQIERLLDGSHPYIQSAYNFALKNYDQALRWLTPSNNNYELARQLYAKRLVDFGLILRARNALLPIASGSIVVNYEIARIELAVGNLPVAKEVANKILQQSDTNPYGIALNALVLHHQEKTDEALATIKIALGTTDSISVRRQIAVDAVHLFMDGNAPETLVSLFSSLPALSPIESAILFHLGDSTDTNLEKMALAAHNRYPLFDVQFHVGMGLLKAGKVDEALPILQEALNWQPTNTSLLTALQEIYTAKEDEKTIERTKQVISNIANYPKSLADPRNEESYAVIPASSEKLKKEVIGVIQQKVVPKVVLDQFATLIKKQKKPVSKALLHMQRGSLFLLMQRYEEAAQDMKVALKTPKLSAEDTFVALTYLGKALSLMKDFEAAGVIYKRISQLEPELPLYRQLAGEALMRAKALDEAEAYMEESIALYPTSVTYYITLAQIYSQNGKQKEAVEILRKAIRAVPLYAPAYSVLSKAQSITNNTDAAKENSTIVSNLTKRI